MVERSFRRRVTTALVFAAGALAVARVLGSHAPKLQTLRIVLGDGAPAVTEVRVRYADASVWLPRMQSAHTATEYEWLREATFRFNAGTAPRIVTHESHLPDGDYEIEIDVLAGGKPATIARHEPLKGGTLSVDVSVAIAR